MKNSKRFLALLLIMVMALAIPLHALADDTGGDDTDSIEHISKGKGKTKTKPAKDLKNLVKAQKNEVEAAKDQLEQEIDQLEALCEAADESGDTELAAQLRLQLQEMKLTQQSYKDQMKDLIGQMKLTMRNRYTEEELEQLKKVAVELGQDPDLFVLPVENIISDKVNFKFDTPPVIKGSRTLIPVRAIVQGFGAEVSWDEETQTVTIVKDDREIVLTLGNSTIYVNGEEHEIDTPAELINNRTFVPLRFLIHNFGLNAKWDENTQTVEIDDDDMDGDDMDDDDMDDDNEGIE